MFFHSSELQFEVRVDKPNPLFAKMLQQAIGGIEGEIRVCLQYMFQAWGARGPVKYRDMLLETGTEEIGHIEMLATAVALNLQNAPMKFKEEIATNDGMVEAVLGGINPRHILSSGLAAMPVNSDGVPFDCSHIYASGNLAADMYANVTAESTGRMLAIRLYNMTDDSGMKNMLSYLIARDTMHQNQWLAVIEELGGMEVHPIPNSFSQDQEAQKYSYAFMSTTRDSETPPQGRWTMGQSIDGRGNFSTTRQPGSIVPNLGPARPDSGAQLEQIKP
ncbi:MAG TPA: manganese catalase family protein [Anaerolineae bacterium]|nr:manganese catalase family protein [Anaerolineae bacterium]HMR63932.1 manganese catalase family protein [Anaerolineae bacterium]